MTIAAVMFFIVFFATLFGKRKEQGANEMFSRVRYLARVDGTASRSDIDALLESIGFQYGKAGTEFSHPNLLIFLDSNLRIAKWIYGTDYSGSDVDLALKIAAGESDWVGQHSEWLYALLLFSGSLLCVARAYYVSQLSVLRRATRNAAAN